MGYSPDSSLEQELADICWLDSGRCSTPLTVRRGAEIYQIAMRCTCSHCVPKKRWHKLLPKEVAEWEAGEEARAATGAEARGGGSATIGPPDPAPNAAFAQQRPPAAGASMAASIADPGPMTPIAEPATTPASKRPVSPPRQCRYTTRRPRFAVQVPALAEPSKLVVFVNCTCSFCAPLQGAVAEFLGQETSESE